MGLERLVCFLESFQRFLSIVFSSWFPWLCLYFCFVSCWFLFWGYDEPVQILSGNTI